MELVFGNHLCVLLSYPIAFLLNFDIDMDLNSPIVDRLHLPWKSHGHSGRHRESAAPKLIKVGLITTHHRRGNNTWHSPWFIWPLELALVRIVIGIVGTMEVLVVSF